MVRSCPKRPHRPELRNYIGFQRTKAGPGTRLDHIASLPCQLEKPCGQNSFHILIYHLPPTACQQNRAQRLTLCYRSPISAGSIHFELVWSSFHPLLSFSGLDGSIHNYLENSEFQLCSHSFFLFAQQIVVKLSHSNPVQQVIPSLIIAHPLVLKLNKFVILCEYRRDSDDELN